jgi:hypothetical protein
MTTLFAVPESYPSFIIRVPAEVSPSQEVRLEQLVRQIQFTFWLRLSKTE